MHYAVVVGAHNVLMKYANGEGNGLSARYDKKWAGIDSSCVIHTTHSTVL